MLNYILNGINEKQFFSDYYEKKHLVIHRKNSKFYSEILQYSQLDELLFSANLFHPEQRVVDNSQDTFPDPKTYTIKNSNRIDPLKFARYHTQGSTLVFSAAQDRIFNLRKLTLEMESFFKHPFQTNIYLTPKSAQGFAPHYDTHDVFILQFEGEKRWRIYESDVKLADKSIPHEKGTPTGKIIDEFTLKQGDLLYIPRGIVHDAFCTNENSGHITLGLLGKTWAETIATQLINTSKEHLNLRKYPKYHHSSQNPKELDAIKSILHQTIDDLFTKDDVINDFLGKQKAIAKGQLLQIINLDKLDLNSAIQFREKSRIRITKTEDELELAFYDIKVSFPIYCDEFVQRVLEASDAIPINSIACELDDEAKLTLVEELAKQGMLEIVRNQKRQNSIQHLRELTA